MPGVPGVFANGDNPHARTLRQRPWSALPVLLGKHAERVLSDLLVHGGIFTPVDESSNLLQLSGVPLCELKADGTGRGRDEVKGPAKNAAESALPRSCGWRDIRFVRHRMLYARPTLNGRGGVTYGLGATHVLNRLQDANDRDVRTLKYVFPRQFGLHNVFTSHVDLKHTSHSFTDYGMREKEITLDMQAWRKRHAAVNSAAEVADPPLPKRLRRRALALVSRMRRRHSRCSYAAMLEHYCPRHTVDRLDLNKSLEHATSAASVSAFCRAVVGKVFPSPLWGENDTRAHNQETLMHNIDTFIRLRRYESLSLHDVMQGMRVGEIEWLADGTAVGSKMSRTDFAKRTVLLGELLYYLFDSFLIPLIRSHFHVTESGTHRNQLFYFRHDVWNALSEPALKSLKDTMLERCDPSDLERRLARRALGVSQLRLLPKEVGMRPIINLRRRAQKLQYGRMILARSINSILTPAFSILNYEKSAHQERLGSALFSVEDIYPRLYAFRESLRAHGCEGRPLYFAKVDVRACFDTIPHKRLMELVRKILGADAYRLSKYARAKVVGGPRSRKEPVFGARPSWRFLTRATPHNTSFNFKHEVNTDVANGRTRTVYVDGGVQRSESRRGILSLLEEHIESHLIRVGKQTFRQKIGIPQGSVVSSLLCSYFYAELEREVLGFVHDSGPTTLLRLIDDFLVITADREVAVRFMRTMHAGVDEFGVHVKPEKSRVNFDLEIDGTAVPRVPACTQFSYCGHAIDTVTLDLRKDHERRKKNSMSARRAALARIG